MQVQWQHNNGEMLDVVDHREIKGLLYLLTHLSPRVCLDLGKLELSVVGVHLTDLLPGWGPKNLEHRGGTFSEHER